MQCLFCVLHLPHRGFISGVGRLFGTVSRYLRSRQYAKHTSLGGYGGMLLSRRIMMSQKPFRMLVAILCTEILKRILNASVAQSASCQNPPDPISAAIFYFPEGEIPVHSSPPPRRNANAKPTQTQNQHKRKTSSSGGGRMGE